AQAGLDPVQMELLAPGALGRRLDEPGLVEQALQQPLVDIAGGGEGAIGIERGAGVALAPGIQQGIGRAGVEAADRAPARQQGVVADAAEVEDGAVLGSRVQQGGMEGGNQRRALATGGNVAAAAGAGGGGAGTRCTNT